jgi:hypothetical protein
VDFRNLDSYFAAGEARRKIKEAQAAAARAQREAAELAECTFTPSINHVPELVENALYSEKKQDDRSHWAGEGLQGAERLNAIFEEYDGEEIGRGYFEKEDGLSFCPPEFDMWPFRALIL